jgi:hypothetical protein
MDGYESHLSFQFVRYCEMEKVIVLRLPPIFQQWKHWHAEAIDKAIRQGVSQFDRQTFLATVESIRNPTFSRANINSSFRRCGFVHTTTNNTTNKSQ